MNAPTENPAGSGDTSISAAPPEGSKRSLQRAMIFGFVGLVAALVSFAAIRMTGQVFQLPEELAVLTRTIPGPEDQRRVAAGMVVINYKNYAVHVGIAGAIAGALFGLTLGIIRRSRTSLIVGTIGGVVLGGAFATGAGYFANYLGESIVTPVRLDKMYVPEHYSMFLHGVTWMIVGLGVGLGTGLGATEKRISSALSSMLVCGICGAAAGAFYPFFGSAVLPLADTSMTIPNGDLNRIAWLALPCILMGLVIGRKG